MKLKTVEQAKQAIKVLKEHMTIHVIKPGHHKYLAWKDSYILQSLLQAYPISKEE